MKHLMRLTEINHETSAWTPADAKRMIGKCFITDDDLTEVKAAPGFLCGTVKFLDKKLKSHQSIFGFKADIVRTYLTQKEIENGNSTGTTTSTSSN